LTYMLLNGGRLLGELHVGGVRPFLAVLYVENNFVVLLNFTPKTRHVYEDVLAALGGCNKPEALGAIEEFYCSLLHLYCFY
jgi:hypothetical protein